MSFRRPPPHAADPTPRPTQYEKYGYFEVILAGLWQDHALGPPVAYDAIARRWLTRPVSARNYCRGSATVIPLADSTIDTVVMTWTLARSPTRWRVSSRPGGKLLFVEHRLSPEPRVERWQHRLTPIWFQVAGGCRLDRKMDDLIRSAGFGMTRLRTA